MNNIRNTEYESFRKNIDLIFDRETFNTKSDLEILMKEYGLHYNKKWGNLRPTNKQLDLAWDYARIKIGTKWEKVEVKEKIQYITVKKYSYKRNNKIIHVKSYRRKKYV